MDDTATREKTLNVARAHTCLKIMNRKEVQPLIHLHIVGIVIQPKTLYIHRHQKGRHVSSPSKYENYPEQKDSRRRREADYDDGDDEAEEEVQSPVRGKTPTPS